VADHRVADIFISYARADRDRVIPLVKLLETKGWSIWWDRDLIPGSAYEQVIDEAIAAAKCVIVVWSRHSVNSEWVQAEAGDGLDRHVLIPVLLDDVRVPISFRRKHGARLFGWPAEQDRGEIDLLLRGVGACLAGEMQVMENTAEYTTTTTERVRSRRRWRWIAAAVVGCVGVVAGLAFLASTVVRVSLVDSDQSSARAGEAIAVLPFEGAEKFPVEGQLRYEVADSLRRIPGLRVLSEEAADLPLGGDPTVIGRRLSVDFIITGRLYESRKATRLQVALFNTLNAGQLWNETFKVDSEDASEISLSVVRQVVRLLELPSSDTANPAGDVGSDAYLAYLRGRAALRQPVTSGKTREDAIRNFDRAASLDPRFALAYAGLCRAYLAEFEQRHEADAFEAAERNCHRALTLDDGSSAVLIALGSLYAASGQNDRALGYFERALVLTPYDADALRGLGNVNARMGLVQQAEKAYRTAIRVEPTYWENYRRLGGLYFMVGRYDRAAEEYQREADLNPNKAASLNNLGSAHYMGGEFKAAIADWTQSFELDADPGALSNLGSAQFFDGEFEEAAATYQRALAMKPKEHSFCANVGEAYYFAGDDRWRGFYERANELAEQQLNINPDDYTTLSAKAYYEAALGDAKDADAAIQRAIELNGKDVYTWYDAARAYMRLNRPADAVKAIQRALDLGYSRHLVEADANFASIAKSIREKQQ
jgi:tetratricopeptide (TPR) repeat protein